MPRRRVSKKGKYTTIRVSVDTAKSLSRLGSHRESYDKVISAILKENQRIKRDLEKMANAIRKA
jgi:hypothetical protein